MSKKSFTMKNKKASKVYKCDGQLLRKIITDKGFMPTELSRMMDYCSDYLNSCTRKNKISDVCVKKLMGYRIFPQMYGVEGEIKVDEPEEVKIDKDDNSIYHYGIKGTKWGVRRYQNEDGSAPNDALSHCLKKRMDMINRNSTYGIPKPDKEVEFGTPYGIVRSERNLRNYIMQAIGPNSPNWGTNLIGVRDMLENACFNGMPYDLEDMRNDLLSFAANVDKYPEKWVDFVRRMSLQYEPDRKRTPFEPTAQEIKKVLNEKYGTLEKGVKGIDYDYGSAPKNPSYCSFYAAGHTIAKGFYQLMYAAMNDLKHDPEFKEMIKQAVKEAYEEL